MHKAFSLCVYLVGLVLRITSCHFVEDYRMFMNIIISGIIAIQEQCKRIQNDFLFLEHHSPEDSTLVIAWTMWCNGHQ